MNLVKITQNLLKAQSKSISNKEWNTLKQQLNDELEQINKAQLLHEVLALDTGDVLPFEQKKGLYEKLIQLEGKKANFQSFAWWLQLNGGPDWDEYAEQLLDRAKSLL